MNHVWFYSESSWASNASISFMVFLSFTEWVADDLFFAKGKRGIGLLLLGIPLLFINPYGENELKYGGGGGNEGKAPIGLAYKTLGP